MDQKGIFKFLKLDNLIEHLSGYIEDKIALVKIEVKEEIAAVVVRLSVVFLLLMIILFALLFGSVVLALFLSTVFNSQIIGFGMVGVFYIILFITVFLLRNNKRLEDGLEKLMEKLSGK